jgi:hypothetical protein
LTIGMTGGLNRLGHPAVHATLQTGSGEANIRRVVTTLPRGELLDNAHFGAVCLKADFAAQTCPPASKIGRAEVDSPLLDAPLTGSVYLRTSSHGLPDLAVDLNGQIKVETVAHIDSVNERLRADFATIPDVPLGTVRLDLQGGSKGLIQNSEPLCPGRTRRATARMVGQNGATVNRRPTVKVSCKGRRG